MLKEAAFCMQCNVLRLAKRLLAEWIFVPVQGGFWIFVPVQGGFWIFVPFQGEFLSFDPG